MRTSSVDFERYRVHLMDALVAGAAFTASSGDARGAIVERIPMAIARLTSSYPVDSRGVIIDEAACSIGSSISGRGWSDGRSRTRRDPARALPWSGLEKRARPELRQRAASTNDARDVVVLLDTEAVLVHLGEGRFVERLKTYVELGPTRRNGCSIDYVDMHDERAWPAKEAGQARAEGRSRVDGSRRSTGSMGTRAKGKG